MFQGPNTTSNSTITSFNLFKPIVVQVEASYYEGLWGGLLKEIGSGLQPDFFSKPHHDFHGEEMIQPNRKRSPAIQLKDHQASKLWKSHKNCNNWVSLPCLLAFTLANLVFYKGPVRTQHCPCSMPQVLQHCSFVMLRHAVVHYHQSAPLTLQYCQWICRGYL